MNGIFLGTRNSKLRGGSSSPPAHGLGLLACIVEVYLDVDVDVVDMIYIVRPGRTNTSTLCAPESRGLNTDCPMFAGGVIYDSP